MGRCGEDVTEIDVKPDGSWRAKNDREHLDLAQWHFPDGSLCIETGKNVKPDLENSKQIKHDGPLEGQSPFKLGIKKNSNGTWEVNKPELLTLSPESQLEEKYDIHCGGGFLRSSSGTGSARDVDDQNANRDVGGQFDFLPNNGNELDSVSPNFDSAYEVPSAPVGKSFFSWRAVFETGQSNACGTSFSVPSLGVPVSYPEDPGLITDSALDLLNSYGDEFEMPLWPSVASCTHAGPGFQFFGTETDVSDSLEDAQRTSINCPTSTNGGFSLAPETTLGSATQISESICHSNTNVNGVLIDNSLTIGEDDPSLQIFLPTHPTASSAPTDVRDPPVSTNGIREEDWISLRVGDGVGHDRSSATNGLNAGHGSVSKEASSLPSSNGERSDRTTTNQQKSASLFSFPLQAWSVRPRLYLSIDSDSD